MFCQRMILCTLFIVYKTKRFNQILSKASYTHWNCFVLIIPIQSNSSHPNPMYNSYLTPIPSSHSLFQHPLIFPSHPNQRWFTYHTHSPQLTLTYLSHAHLFSPVTLIPSLLFIPHPFVLPSHQNNSNIHLVPNLILISHHLLALFQPILPSYPINCSPTSSQFPLI